MSEIRIIQNYQIDGQSVVLANYDAIYGVEFLLDDESTVRVRIDKGEVVVDAWPHTERTVFRVQECLVCMKIVCPICHSTRDGQGRCRCRGRNIGYEDPMDGTRRTDAEGNRL